MKWTPDEVALAEALISARVPEREFRAKIGRSRTACLAKIDRVRYLSSRAGTVRSTPAKVPDHIIADAVKRANAPRSVTAWICGDPPPGFSALERRA